MSIHINEVLEYLDAHPLNCYEKGLNSFMEFLHDAYTAYNKIDSEEIHVILKGIQSVQEKLSANETEKLYNLIYDLCFAHEVLAFSHGIVVGMHLMTEVNYLP